MVKVKVEPAGLFLPVAVIMLFFMLTPALGLLKVWPLSSAVTSGLTLLCVGLLFGVALLNRRDSSFRFNAPVLLFLSLVAVLVSSVALNTYTYETTWRWYLIFFIVC